MKSKIIASTLLVIGFLAGASALSALADWTAAPAGGPPGCPSTVEGCNAPINVGTTEQRKSGPLVVNFNSIGDIGLTVLGKLKIIDAGAVAGTNNGKVLTSDANGVGTWQTPSGGTEGNNISSGPGVAKAWITWSNRSILASYNILSASIENSGYDLRVTFVTPMTSGYIVICNTTLNNTTGTEAQTFAWSRTNTSFIVRNSFASGADPIHNGNVDCVVFADANPNRVISFSNGSTYPYNTLSSSGNSITSAIETSANIGGAASNAMTLDTAKTYRVTYTYTPSSGSSPSIRFVSTANGRSTIQGLNSTALSGTNSVTFTPTSSNGYLEISVGNGVSTSFNMSNVILQEW
ncbi:MAG: hypothetical protein A3C79_03425 [Candidatus Taylorbacteria bacterium RIFCSPHIGHO2_02_FULL_45_28]|uniref:Uncharacterized protein n=1 Tax=Candidatus Taylorbacteria bacterium RIFCSPHIGHO2_12_FULL_45_16 TaxID=1802315 RepID=A0A1G2N1B5_9BACT|nr:MAG: hypothetical protein A2830_01140 [Candidatus Taylorbacteria bacterium RIFCSPHIGHO2_01_FULL_44_110]OHA25008.1 MAG: hypothetical protein A3C79_03425 [Candidatus Taylorbacteria bacterium RIFCSPHIGHO2_02_FULL_45_28]OHA29823.1 MAG: hypothetical protein A3F51_03825 [Candidatus Taylorbacteria bacterium RIFCSPHIGHO2_12_FULL_45_16]OHA32769.1 MAG: hypothetical protein A3A23_00705 [Candidatus Taylorbacteria bacterium RIFCSPLOWO2_01_FULL_45_59]OHA39846.1 MAG: hypothetical protein A3I98_03725 [Candi